MKGCSLFFLNTTLTFTKLQLAEARATNCFWAGIEIMPPPLSLLDQRPEEAGGSHEALNVMMGMINQDHAVDFAAELLQLKQGHSYPAKASITLLSYTHSFDLLDQLYLNQYTKPRLLRYHNHCYKEKKT